MHYDLKDLHLFQAIAQAGNLSSGAAVMHLTASSASYRLKNLEYAVGSQLFTRHPKGMSLTPAGEVLARHTKQLLAGVAAMHAELGAYSSHLRGSIRLLANSSSLNSFLIPSLARFLVSNVNINVDLREQESPTISQSIVESQADIGIGADLERLPGLHRELYAVDRLVCVVAPGHPLSHASDIAFRDVLAYDLVCVERTSSNYLYLSNQARLAGIPMKVRVHVHNFRALIYMVESGVGAAIVPASTAHEAARAQRVVAVSMTDAWAERNLYLVYPKDSGQPELVREFARILLNDPHVANERESAL